MITFSRSAVACVLVFAMSAGIAHATDAQHRETKAHAHGHGKANIVIEGQRLHIELEVPGADIVGFEHAAKTDAEKAAVTEAKAVLGSAVNVVELPAAAGCKTEKTSVEFHRDGTHGEFHVSYQFQCRAATKLDPLTFTYFEQFKRADELDISIITDKGARKFDVNRQQPAVRLGALL